MRVVGILKTYGDVQPVNIVGVKDIEDFFKNHPEFFIVASFENGRMTNIKFRANAKTNY